MRIYTFLFAALLAVSCTTCSKEGGINLFSIEDDVALGMQLRDQALSDSSGLDILDRQQYASAYNYVEGVVNDIITSGEVTYAQEFAWEVYIVRDDSTLNAFAAPGGYIFVYTGLIDFLDRPSAFAGVLAHEMAHADRRHSTQQLTKAYGLSFLLDIVLGNNRGIASDVLATLLSLRFSRSDESEADEYSVAYLCKTPYAANGAADFFEKLQAEGNDASPPEFLSTHPSPDNRVADINAEAAERGCNTQSSASLQAWNQFKASLP